MKKYLFACIAAMLVASSAFAEEDCRLTRATSLPISPENLNRIIIPAELDGKSLNMMIDTGSNLTGISNAAAARLGIEPHLITGSWRPIFPYAGGRVTHFVKAHGFKLGNMMAERAQLMILPREIDETDGLMGADFLRQFDVEFDFAGAKVNLFKPHPCPGKVVYWAPESSVAVIPFRSEQEDGHIRVDLTLDGKSVPTILDTGAPTTALSDEAARDWFHVDEKTPGVHRVGRNTLRYRFGTLALDGVVVQNPDISIIHGSSTDRPNYEILLGLNVLRQLRVLVAYKEHKLYVTSASAH